MGFRAQLVVDVLEEDGGAPPSVAQAGDPVAQHRVVADELLDALRQTRRLLSPRLRPGFGIVFVRRDLGFLLSEHSTPFLDRWFRAGAVWSARTVEQIDLALRVVAQDVFQVFLGHEALWPHPSPYGHGQAGREDQVHGEVGVHAQPEPQSDVSSPAHDGEDDGGEALPPAHPHEHLRLDGGQFPVDGHLQRHDVCFLSWIALCFIRRRRASWRRSWPP